MDRKTVLAAAGALVLTVVGGMSALAVAFGSNSPADATETTDAATPSTVVITEYVDEAGNPLSGPDAVAAPAAETFIVPVQGQADEIFVVRNSDGTTSLADDQGPSTDTTGDPAASFATDTSGSDDEYEGSDDEYEGSEDEYEGSDDEYEASGSQTTAGDHHDGDDESEGDDD